MIKQIGENQWIMYPYKGIELCFIIDDKSQEEINETIEYYKTVYDK